jgi:hypothetical protein
MIADPPRLTHERHLHRRQNLFCRQPSHARGTRQVKGICDTIKILGHQQVGIIDDIVGPVGLAVTHCGHTTGRKIVGMNVVSKNIIGGDQCGQAFFQALERQTIRGINTWRSQDGNPDTRADTPLAQTVLGIDPPPGSRTLRIKVPHLVNLRPTTIAINARRAYVNKLAW